MDNLGEAQDLWKTSAPATFGQINPGLMLFKAPGAPHQWWNTDLSVNTSKVANWVNNFYKLDPLGVSQVGFLTDWSGDSFADGAAKSTSDYATALVNLTNYLLNFTMPNGRKFPLGVVCGKDEPGDSESTLAGYYNAFIPRIKAINSNLLTFGPIRAGFGVDKDFGVQVPQLDGWCSNQFGASNIRSIRDWNTLPGSQLRYVGLSSGGSDDSCSSPGLNDYTEAMLHCEGMCNALDSVRTMFVGCYWGAIGGGCGLMDYPPDGPTVGQFGPQTGSGQIYPIGYWYAQGVRNIYGPRWNVPTNTTGMFTVAVTPAAGRFGLLLYNTGNGNRSGAVALSHWPVNSSGTATANVWQMTSAQSGPGQDGRHSTVQVTAGVTATMSFPDPSITVISI